MLQPAVAALIVHSEPHPCTRTFRVIIISCFSEGTQYVLNFHCESKTAAAKRSVQYSRFNFSLVHVSMKKGWFNSRGPEFCEKLHLEMYLPNLSSFAQYVCHTGMLSIHHRDKLKQVLVCSYVPAPRTFTVIL